MMTREEALTKIAVSDCISAEWHEAHKILLEALNKLEAIENASLIEINDDFEAKVHDALHLENCCDDDYINGATDAIAFIEDLPRFGIEQLSQNLDMPSIEEITETDLVIWDGNEKNLENSLDCMSR